MPENNTFYPYNFFLSFFFYCRDILIKFTYSFESRFLVKRHSAKKIDGIVNNE